MLYQRWINIVSARKDTMAVRDISAGRSWTFHELAEAVENARPDGDARIIFPSGGNVDFVLTVLKAWKLNRVVCPLEVNALAPAILAPPPGIAHLKLTSGTTGAAKCVAFTEAQIAADADAIVATMGLRPDSPNLAAISLAHSYGFSNLVTPLLLHGIPLILAPSPLPAAFRQAASQSDGLELTVPAVPAMWRTWHDAGSIPGNIRLAISAAASLPLSLESALFERYGLKIHNFLGASECGGIAYDASATPRTDAAFAGHPLEGVTIRSNDHGELEVKGPAVGETYWPTKGPNLAAGVYHSSDLVELDEMGGLMLKGRGDDLINVAGRKVAPETIESTLRKHPAIKECLVLGLPSNDYRGEVIAAVFDLREPCDEALLQSFAMQNLPGWQVPRVWKRTTDLKPNVRGKFSRAEWRARLLKD